MSLVAAELGEGSKLLSHYIRFVYCEIVLAVVMGIVALVAIAGVVENSKIVLVMLGIVALFTMGGAVEPN